MVNVYNVEVYKNELCPNGCIRLFWEGDMGIGYYDLVVKTAYGVKIEGYSECMDNNTDKEFLKSLLESMVGYVNVVE